VQSKESTTNGLLLHTTLCYKEELFGSVGFLSGGVPSGMEACWSMVTCKEVSATKRTMY
jgi:hypothetical protein